MSKGQLNLFSQEARIVYMDVETLRSAEEVGGWNNISKMGLACGVCYDSLDKKFSVYGESGVNELVEHLLRAKLVIGFNHIRFDYEVLSVYTSIDLRRTLRSFDILEDLTHILGHRVSLDSVAQGTLQASKTADGQTSLMWVKQGRMDLVEEYCRKDVEITRDIFLFGMNHQFVRFQGKQGLRQIAVRWNLRELLCSETSDAS